MTPALRLAQLVIADPKAAVSMASRIVTAEKAKRTRVLARSKPRRDKEKAKDTNAAALRATLRSDVFARAAGRCEACLVRPISELHHVLSGPARRFKESPETCAALCLDCHRDVHRNDIGTLSNLRSLMMRVGSIEAVSSLSRRIDKIRSRTP